jgi:CubicO group peptidase (beta-lactamase class C family)
VRLGRLDRAAVDALVTRAQREVDDGFTPSGQIALGLDGEIVESVALGDADLDDRFVVFSCTKAVVASAIWQLLAESSLRLDDKVADHIPEFATNGKDVVTVEQVLLHTAGFPRAPLGPPRWARRDERLDTFARWRLNWEPGSRYEYHATSAHWVLGELLAAIDGFDHRDALRTRVLEPLGLHRLQLGVPAADQRDIRPPIPTGDAPTPTEVAAVLGFELDLGEVTEDALISLGEGPNLEVGVPGAGAVSTAADLALFYQALLQNRDDVWDPEWLARGTSEVRIALPDPLVGGVLVHRTLGLVVNADDGSGRYHGFGHGNSPKAFGHAGANGQLAWADPATGLSFAYLTDGADRNVIRQGRRSVALSSRAAACVHP